MAGRRNKVVFGAVATVATALVVGQSVSIWQAARARNAEQAAKEKAVLAVAEHNTAVEARSAAEQERERANRQRTDLVQHPGILDTLIGILDASRQKSILEIMETRSTKLIQFLSLLCLVVWAVGPRAAVQTAAELDIQLYAGLTITGAVGTVYSVEYLTDLAQTTNASAWRCLEFLQLPASPYLRADKSAPAPAKRFYRAVAMGAPTNMVFIPPGTFRMGSPTNEVDRWDDEGPQTGVTISRGFWMGQYEVTQGEYVAIMGTNPSFFNGDRSAEGWSNYATDLSRPVEQVSWVDATNYCGRLTQRERAAGRIPTDSLYRLPTEAEWEYACRGWTSTRFSYGDDPGYTNLTAYAWYHGGATHPVGQKLPNPWGLYDMHGNVWEWCQDWFAEYRAGVATDPQGPVTGSARVFRGGDWGCYAWLCRSASRYDFGAGDRHSDIGFRIVLDPGQP